MAEAVVQEQVEGERAEMRMFMKVITSDCIVKSQQRDERDLTVEEKVGLLLDLLRTKPATFLARFGPLLDEADLGYFGKLPSYEIAVQVKELMKTAGSEGRRRQTRNRRYNCMKGLMRDTDYFSTEQMRERNPLLYEYYVGQYMTDDEKIAAAAAGGTDPATMALSEHIFLRMDRERTEGVLYRQRLEESKQYEERDDDEDSEDEEEEEGGGGEGEGGGYIGSYRLSRNPKRALEEKQMLREEFLREMQESFLSGTDQGVDYHSVDTGPQYDSLELRGRDEEESYFDGEEPRTSCLAGEGGGEGVMEEDGGSMEYDY